MIRYRSEATIQRPPSEVFAALLDPERYGQWTDMTDMRFEGSGPPRVGTKGTFRLPKTPFRGDLSVEITELEPDRRVVFKVTHPALDWTNWAEVRPEGSGTHLLYAGEMELRGWRRLLEPILRKEIASAEEGEVDRLKQLLESEGAGATREVQASAV